MTHNGIDLASMNARIQAAEAESHAMASMLAVVVLRAGGSIRVKAADLAHVLDRCRCVVHHTDGLDGPYVTIGVEARD